MKIINWNNYLVREDGVIFNKDGSVKNLKENSKGYLFSSFYINGEWKTRSGHRVVAEAFMGPPPEGYEVDHIDNNRANNHINNLQYLTKSENNKKSYDEGNRDVKGFRNANSRYSGAILREVVELLSEGFTYGEVVRLTKVGKGTVAKIAQGKHFIHNV